MQKSRLWRRLDEEIKSAPTPMKAAIPRVRRAVLMARYGHEPPARDELTALHQLNFHSPQPELGAWLHFAEGVTHYFSDFGACDSEKLERAASMAASLNLPELRALCAAWLCWFGVVRLDVNAVVAQARATLEFAEPGHLSALGRLALALAISHDLAGMGAQAQAWYAQARQHVLAEGDDVGHSAVIYNSMAMRVAQARRESLDGAPLVRPEQLLGAESVKHYDAAKQVTLLPELAGLLRAQLLVVAGSFAEAHELYAEHLLASPSHGLTRFSASLLADVAWCRAQLGHHERALQQAEAAEAESAAETAVETRWVTSGRLAQVYKALGLVERAAQADAQAAKEREAFLAEQREWAEALSRASLVA